MCYHGDMSSGESKTPGILIAVIGIVLVGALIGIFFPKGIKQKKEIAPAIDSQGYVEAPGVNPAEPRGTNAYYIKADIDKPVCGIKIFSPLPGQHAAFPLEVSGYVNGCGWVPFEGQVGTIELRDRNRALSQLIIVPVDGDTYTLPAYFKVKITPQIAPTSADGVIIFHNENPSGEKDKAETFQIPIVF